MEPAGKRTSRVKKRWKYILLWSAFLVDNVLGIELQQLQWNMTYWNEKDESLSFETQLKVEFLPPNKGSKKCLEKSLKGVFSGLSPMEHPVVIFHGMTKAMTLMWVI